MQTHCHQTLNMDDGFTARHQPLQNRDAFGVLEPLLDSGLASLETRSRHQKEYARPGE